MTEKLILMHENTPYFIYFFLFWNRGGGGRPPAPPVAPTLGMMD